MRHRPFISLFWTGLTKYLNKQPLVLLSNSLRPMINHVGNIPQVTPVHKRPSDWLKNRQLGIYLSKYLPWTFMFQYKKIRPPPSRRPKSQNAWENLRGNLWWFISYGCFRESKKQIHFNSNLNLKTTSSSALGLNTVKQCQQKVPKNLLKLYIIAV